MQKKYLDTFEEILSVGKNNACANRANPRLLISDLSLLAGQEWLSLEMMEEFINEIKVEIKNTTILSYISLKDIEKAGQLDEKVRDWKKRDVKSICFIANVGKIN